MPPLLNGSENVASAGFTYPLNFLLYHRLHALLRDVILALVRIKIVSSLAIHCRLIMPLLVKLSVKADTNIQKFCRFDPNTLQFSPQSANIPLSESMLQIVSIRG